MPVSIKSVGHGKYSVRTPNGVKAKATTKTKADRQARLLRAIDHGWKPDGRKPKKATEMSVEEFLDFCLQITDSLV